MADRKVITHVEALVTLLPGKATDWEPLARKQLHDLRTKEGFVRGQLLKSVGSADDYILRTSWSVGPAALQFGILGEDAAAEHKGLVKERELIMLEQMDEVVNA